MREVKLKQIVLQRFWTLSGILCVYMSTVISLCFKDLIFCTMNMNFSHAKVNEDKDFPLKFLMKRSLI